jgi:hypothetical protein
MRLLQCRFGLGWIDSGGRDLFLGSDKGKLFSSLWKCYTHDLGGQQRVLTASGRVNQAKIFRTAVL